MIDNLATKTAACAASERDNLHTPRCDGRLGRHPPGVGARDLRTVARAGRSSAPSQPGYRTRRRKESSTAGAADWASASDLGYLSADDVKHPAASGGSGTDQACLLIRGV